MKNIIKASLSRAFLLSLTTTAGSTVRPTVAFVRHSSRPHSHSAAASRSLLPSSSTAAASSVGSSTVPSTVRRFATAGSDTNDDAAAAAQSEIETLQQQPTSFDHTLAVLAVPTNSMDRIANEAILDTAAEYTTKKLSIMLRCEDGIVPTLASLRRYVGEVYSCLWDVALGMGNPDDIFDVVVYAQNLPNAAPERWIYQQPDLDCVCSHDSLLGWTSTNAQGRGVKYQALQGRGQGGLDQHVAAINADRKSRNLPPVHALHVDPWPVGASTPSLAQDTNIIFLDDDNLEPCTMTSTQHALNTIGNDNLNDNDNEDSLYSMIGGPRIPQEALFDHVAVGGTFDGMHYGHRKLLTLAVSSVTPLTGRLSIGVTVDEMLTHKAYADQIPPYEERLQDAKDFVYRFAPGMTNRIKFLPIADAFGPAGQSATYDALVLSHETLENGRKLNEYRTKVKNMQPLTLLCTRRTEAHGMSSTALRRLRHQRRLADAEDDSDVNGNA